MECPHRNELIQLNRDDLPPDRSESLFDHLENCEPCATVFEQLAESTNNLGEHLAGIPQKDIEQAREKIEKRPGIQEPVASTETDSRESPYALSPGQKLEKYEILSLLDSGGMGEVYEARHSLMGHRVAIKVIRGRHQDNPVAYQKFLTEMKTLVRVEHPNLVRALDGGHEDGCLFVVMELLDGKSLHTLCVERKIGSVIEIIDAMLGLCRGLEKLHAHQLLHRDIKPANIMRLTDGTIKVIDLGLAADNVAGRQMSHVGVGTQGYMPPEQTYGSDSLNERSDIFSAGRVLKDLLRALPGSDANSNQTKVASRLETLADWMTKLEMEDRPQSVKEVLPELKKLRRATSKSARRRQTESRPVTAHPPVEERKPGRIFATPGFWITFAALVTLVIVLANVAPESDSDADQTAAEEAQPELQNKIPHSDSSSTLQTDQEAAAQQLGLPKSLSVQIDAGQTTPLQFVLIPAGEFQMGMPTELKLLPGETAASKPAHTVRISKPFYISQFEVSEQQFRAVAGGGLTPVIGDGGQFPATQITWSACVKFCTTLTATGRNIPTGAIVRLPTEAEWEYACRAGTTTRYWFGKNIEPHHASYRHRSMSLKPCDAFAPNPFGLYNVHGNVAEWCSDWFDPDYYDWFDPETPTENPKGPETGTTKVIRGGGYSNPPFAVTSFWRQSYPQGTRSASIGVRPVIELMLP